MTRLFLAFIFLPIVSFGQTSRENSSLIPANLRLRPLLDSINYIDVSPRWAIIKYLNSKKLNPQNYFIDSLTHKIGDTLCIQVWDVEGLHTINRYEGRKDSVDKVNSISKEKKRKLPKPVGNPGNCFTAYFDIKNNVLIAAELWQ